MDSSYSYGRTSFPKRMGNCCFVELFDASFIWLDYNFC